MPRKTDIAIKKVQEFPDALFKVTITGRDGTRTDHTVSLNEQYYKQLTNGVVLPDRLMRESFLFLLEREPQQSIFTTFDLPVISRYFPEYEQVLQTRITHI